MSAPKNFGMYLQVYFLLVSYIPRGSRAVPFQVDGTHTHTSWEFIVFSLQLFFSVLFCLFPLFFCASYMERRREAQDGSVPLDSSSRTTCGKKKRSISNAHTHTQVKDGLGCCCPSLCVVVSEPDGGGRKPWERPARRDRNIYALASEVSFVIECTTEHPVRFLSFLFFS